MAHGVETLPQTSKRGIVRTSTDLASAICRPNNESAMIQTEGAELQFMRANSNAVAREGVVLVQTAKVAIKRHANAACILQNIETLVSSLGSKHALANAAMLPTNKACAIQRQKSLSPLRNCGGCRSADFESLRLRLAVADVAPPPEEATDNRLFCSNSNSCNCRKILSLK